MKREMSDEKRAKLRRQAKSNKYAGRGYQSKMARRLGGKSVGTIEGQDIEHPVFSFECKKMAELPGILCRKAKSRDEKKKGQLKDAGHWTQCLKNCPEGKIPLLLMHQTGMRHEDDLVVLRLEDFERLVDPKKLVIREGAVSKLSIIKRRDRNVD